MIYEIKQHYKNIASSPMLFIYTRREPVSLELLFRVRSAWHDVHMHVVLHYSWYLVPLQHVLVLLFLTIAMPNTTTPLHLLPNTQIFICIPTLNGSILLAGPPSTFIIAVRMVGATKVLRTTPWQCRKQCSRDGQPFGCAVLFPLLRITVPSFPSLSPPSITVPSFPSLSPSFPSLSPSFPSLSPPSYHCPLLPITSCYHGRLFPPPPPPNLVRTPLEC